MKPLNKKELELQEADSKLLILKLSRQVGQLKWDMEEIMLGLSYNSSDIDSLLAADKKRKGKKK